MEEKEVREITERISEAKQNMEKKELIITVSGQVASGKSRLTFLLKKFLRENGFEVEFDGNTDHPTESNFDKHMSKNFDEVINNIKETRKITFKEVQLARDCKRD